jgi:flagellar protein FliO/FliZ
VPYDSFGLDSLSLSLGVIVLLLWGGVWAMRRMRPGGSANARDLSVVRSLALGPRERVLVVQVGPRHLVLGVGSTSVSLLCELEEPLPAIVGDDRFGQAIRKAVDRWRGG